MFLPETRIRTFGHSFNLLSVVWKGPVMRALRIPLRSKLADLVYAPRYVFSAKTERPGRDLNPSLELRRLIGYPLPHQDSRISMWLRV